MDKYKFIDELKSDVMYEAYGKDLKELFCNCAEAMFSVICQIQKIKSKESIELEINGKDLKDTLWNFLTNLIAEVDIHQMFFCKFEISQISETKVIAKAYGQEIKPELGDTVVKSLTNYKYDITKTKEGYKAMISLDI
jgi:protein archease